MSEDATMNIVDLLDEPETAYQQVLKMQTKLHQWSNQDRLRRFDDIYNLVYDPAFLVTAWMRVRGNKGAKTAGIDGQSAYKIEHRPLGVARLLTRIHHQLKVREFAPVPVRQVQIPKPGTTKKRTLGIPTVADRVVQAAVKLVLEPIFETDFHPSSYGFRPGRRCQDAIEEIRYLGHRGYQWVFEADIAACFDQISHTALMGRVRDRVKDKRMAALVKAFLKAGVLDRFGQERRTVSGTPQGGVLSPLLANIALGVLDEHFQAKWDAHNNPTARKDFRRKGGATFRMVRYADDFVVMVFGQRHHAEALREEVAEVLEPWGLHLAEEKTRVVSLEEGFDFLGFHIRWCRQRGSDRYFVYSWPAKKALQSIKDRIRGITHDMRHEPLAAVLSRLSLTVRGWTNYFRHSAAKRTFSYLRYYLWKRVVGWMFRHHGPRVGWKRHRRAYFADGWWPRSGETVLFNPTAVDIVRYKFRGTRIPTPWAATNKARI